MLIYLAESFGITDSPYFAAFLIAILGVILGKYLRSWLCGLISILTLGTSLYLLTIMKEMALLIAFGDMFFSMVLSVSMWVTVLVVNRNKPTFKNLVEKLKISVLR